MVSDDNKVIATLGEIGCLLEATARASPSTAAYRSSAGDRKREPVRVIFHPPEQQSGAPEGQL